MTKAPADLRSLARAHTDNCVQALAQIVLKSASDSARVSAAALLFERGWGRAPQVHTGADGGDIKIIIRQIIDNVELKTIEHQPKRLGTESADDQ